MQKKEIEKIELEIFLEAIYRRYGYNFRDYSKASLNRRIKIFLDRSPYKSLSDCLSPLLRDPQFFQTFLSNILVSVTEMFRDPSFFIEFIAKIAPIIDTYPFVKIWHAGCASGEEVYSLAILLRELGLSKKTLLYGTDINETSLKMAREGIYYLEDLQNANERYLQAGGKKSLADYYFHKYEFAKLHDSLKENIVFSTHNLESDSVFSDVHVILCKNVFIYFTKPLQSKILHLFHKSLIHRCFLCLGPKESLDFLDEKKFFELFSPTEKIYRKLLG